MNVISYKFAVLVGVSVLGFYSLKPNYRFYYISIISAVFLFLISPVLLAYVLVFSLINYYIGLGIKHFKNNVPLYRVGLILNLAQLFLIKYSSFALDPIFDAFRVDIKLSSLSEFIVPVGISYFTLQGLSYLINLKMNWEKPEKNFAYFFLYISFYPKFLSGPIERSNHFIPQLRGHNGVNVEFIIDGLKLVLYGTFKKIAIANQLAPYAINSSTNDIYADGLTSWVIFLLQPLYLYFDFSGYTDIAIGVSRMLGIKLLPNFNRPFFSESMTAFWKKFHMSLSSWFNDYIFKQISFKYRKWGTLASLLALFVTWMLFGIWHGAGWTFMVVGILQTMAISYEYYTKGFRIKIFSKIPRILNTWISRACTYLFYSLCMVFFFSPNISIALEFLKKMTRFSGTTPFDDISTKPFSLLVYIPIILLLELLQNDYSNMYNKVEIYLLRNDYKARYIRWGIYSILITVIYINGFKSQQFVYANF